ncbi:hypothetical protein FRC10_001001 [Ceratobasidium sp. 414]|nr:hypothetical protein FRC10_001001 [Ceratobasidium sp. 414]
MSTDRFDPEVPFELVRLYLMILAIVSLAEVYRNQLLQNPSVTPAPGFLAWADDRSKGTEPATTEPHLKGGKRARVEELQDPERSEDDEQGEDGEQGGDDGQDEDHRESEHPESSPDPLDSINV